jgi:hypothetical protein
MEENTSNITLQIVLAIAGSIALLAGLFGGGIKAKEIEVPKISMWARIFSSLVGVALIWTAIQHPNSSPSTESPTAIPIPTVQTVSDPILPTSIIPTDVPPDKPTDTPIPTQSPTDTPPLPTSSPTLTPEPRPEIVQFGAPGNPGLLNTALRWQTGNSSTNSYDLTSSPNALTLIAGSHTGQWAEEDSQPVIFYSLEGDFETQVKIVFNPMWGHELAALGVRSSQDHNTWLRLGGVFAVFSEGSGPEQHIVLDIDHQGQGGKIKTSPYPTNTFYLKIKRQGSRFDFLYGSDGVNWTTLQSGYIAEMPMNVEIFLTVGSWGNRGISAEFHEFTVLRK